MSESLNLFDGAHKNYTTYNSVYHAYAVSTTDVLNHITRMPHTISVVGTLEELC